MILSNAITGVSRGDMVKKTGKRKGIFEVGQLCILVAFFLVLFMPGLSVSQESFTKIGETSLFSVCILAEQTYLAAGDFGTVYRTEDGGVKWSIVQTGMTSPLFCIRNIDKSTIYVSGGDGLILKSVDGGMSWKAQNSGTKKHLFSIAFSDARKGVAVGDWGTIIYTNDGGENWSAASWKEDKMLYGVCYADSDNVWIAGEMGLLLRSTDGGKTWNQCPLPVQSTLTAIDFADANRGAFVGIDGVVYETTDGGKSWQYVHGLPPNHYYSVRYNGGALVCAGDYATIMQRNSVKWTKWNLPPDLSVLWLNGTSIKAFDKQSVVLVVGKRGIFIKNIEKMENQG
jgi:photosystem II stability/assembly factor-like uncharacterized protein